MTDSFQTYDELIADGWTERIPGNWNEQGLDRDEVIIVVLGSADIKYFISHHPRARKASKWAWHSGHPTSIAFFKRLQQVTEDNWV